MTIKVKIYDKVKYDPTSRKTAETILENVKGFEMRELSDEKFAKMVLTSLMKTRSTSSLLLTMETWQHTEALTQTSLRLIN